MNIYPHVKANPRESSLEWFFESGAKLKFSHLEYEKNILDWQGSQIPFIGFDELTHFCLTPETDVLTDSGWKNIADLSNSDLLASLTKNEDIEYKPMVELHSFDYKGKLRCVNQRNGVSFRATPNHKAMVMVQLPNNKKVKGEHPYQGWKFKEVKDIKSCYIPRTGKFEGVEALDIPLIKPSHRGHGTNSNSIDVLKIDVWLQFLGWYLAEGCSFAAKNRTGSPIISIRQTEYKNHDEITEMLDNLGFRWRYRTDGSYMIFSRQLFDILKPLGNRHKKRIPDWIFKTSKRQQEIFWNAFVNGDGHVTANGGISIGLCNKGLIDDLQRIAFHLGYTASSGYNFTKTGFHVYRLYASKKSMYGHVKREDWYDEDYEGKVYCPEVKDNHNFFIRVNGRCCWTGNSKKMFFYMLSRNRSTCGVKPYIRATCNPDPESWVAKFIEWWIDQETGFPIPERDAVIRYFIMYGDDYIWGDTKEEVIEKSWSFLEPLVEKSGVDPKEFVKSVTFVSGSIYQNKALLDVNPAYLGNLLSQDEETRAQLLDGNWKVILSENDIYEYYDFLGLFENKYEVDKTGKYITADIAMEGSNKLVLGYWEGNSLEDIEIVDKSDGKEVIDKLVNLATLYKVPNNKIVYDADGVGSYVGGYIKGAIAFNGGLPPKEVTDPISKKMIKENYANLKTQCFYRSGKKVKAGEMSISERVSNKMYDSKMTVRQRFMHERKAIKKHKSDNDGKLRIIPKDEMKIKLGGESPDLMDMFMMREMFNLITNRQWIAI